MLKQVSSIILLALCGISIVVCGNGDSKVYKLVYQDINPNSFAKCVRLMNGTSQIGCQSSQGGNVGVLYHVNSSDQIGQVNQAEYPPYVVLLHADFFTRHAVRSFKSSGRVSGIVVYSKDDYTGKIDGWSPESQCPRERYSLYSANYGKEYSTCQDNNIWNKPGDGLTEEDIPFPVFIMTDYMLAKTMIDCHDKHNSDGQYPLCAAEMRAWMLGAQSTETCVRRNNLQANLSPAQYCDELGSRTIVATLKPTNNSAGESEKTILVTAALDSRSFAMTSTSPGANSATGFITMLATAKALGALNSDMKDSMKKNVVFAVFNGEAFDNMASKRMVYDMARNEFPFKVTEDKWQPSGFGLSDISHVIEFGQLGHVDSDAWVHYDPVSFSEVSDISSGINAIVEALQNNSDPSITFKNESSGIGLVPSSLQSVLAEHNVSGVVITDFNELYHNEFYFSRFDTLSKLGIEPELNSSESEALPLFDELATKLSHISTAAARTIYKLSNSEESGAETINADKDTIAKLLYCYLWKANCSLFEELMEVKRKYSLAQAPLPRYVGVYNYNKRIKKPAVYFTKNLLVSFIGEVTGANSTETCKSDDSKDNINKYFLFNGEMANATTYTCFRATVYDVDGRSPSAVIANYDYAGGSYGAWSESQWSKNAFTLKIFLLQDEVTQGMILFAGLLMLLSSLVIVYIINKKSNILFATNVL